MTGMWPSTVIVVPLLLSLVTLGQAGMSWTPSTSNASAEDGWYTLTWSGIIPPSIENRDDVVVLFVTSKNPVEIGREAPTSYVYPYLLNKTSWEMGEGSFAFFIPNYFSDVQAVYVRGGNLLPPWYGGPSFLPNDSSNNSNTTRGTLMAQATLWTTAWNESGLVRRVLSHSKDPLSVRVTWSAPRVEDPVVHVWTSSGANGSLAGSIETSTFNSSEMCTPPATSVGYTDQGIQLSAEIRGLEPNTLYYYQVGDRAFGLSSIETFISPPFPGGEDSVPLRVLVLADHAAFNRDGSFYFPGGYAEQVYSVVPLAQPGLDMAVKKAAMATAGILWENGGEIIADMIEGKVLNGTRYHAMVINGDIGYASGYISRWSVWLNNFKKTLASIPLLTSAGNHDADDPQLLFDGFQGRSYDSLGECAVPYYSLLRPPQEDPRKLWYSTDMGPVHFVQLSTEQLVSPGSEQYQFLQNDLRSINRSTTPWVIVGWHRPQYVNQPNFSNVTGDSTVAERLLNDVEPLFGEYQVDVVLSGHIHRYTRSCPVLKGTCVGYHADGSARGPVHLMTGNAGTLGQYYSYIEKPSWLEKEIFDFGYGELEISKTTLTFSLITHPSKNEDTRSDMLTLLKPKGWKPDRIKAKKFYQSISPTSNPKMQREVFNPEQILSLLANAPELLASNIQLAVACFGPQTQLYATANAPYASTMRPEDVWLYQASVLTFLNSTYQYPDRPTFESLSIEYTLRYLLSSFHQVKKSFGSLTLPAGCT